MERQWILSMLKGVHSFTVSPFAENCVVSSPVKTLPLGQSATLLP